MASLNAIADSLLTVVDERRQQGGVEYFGSPTGFYHVDQWTGGLAPDNFWIIAARTSLGKTAAALSLAKHVACTGNGVFFFSLEMRAEMLLARMLSMETGIPLGRIIRGKFFGEEEWPRLQAATEELRALPFAIIDTTQTTASLVSQAYELANKVKTPLGLVVVDYLTLLRAPQASEYERVTLASQTLRNLARPDQLNVPIVALAQINRQAEAEEDKRPQLHHIKASGGIEQDAEIVLLLHRPSHYERMRGGPDKEVEDDAEIIVAKNRNGPTGVTKAKFHPRTTKWEQPAPVVKGEPKPTMTLKQRVQQGRKAA